MRINKNVDVSLKVIQILYIGYIIIINYYANKPLRRLNFQIKILFLHLFKTI